MSIIYDWIKVEGTPATELKTDAEMQLATTVGRKLEPIANEIMQHPEGTITIKKSGNIFVDGFPKEMADKIYTSINER